MVKPPNAITTKDALYLKDILSWELLAVKKCTDFQQHIQDPALKQLFRRSPACTAATTTRFSAT